MTSKKQTIQLLATGSLVSTLHYGIYAVNWWTFIDKKISNEEKQICIPLRLNMRAQLELNKIKFIIRIVSVEDGIQPGYVCETDVAAKIHLSASKAINEFYNNLFNNKTRYSGPSVLGFDDENIIQELLSDVLFCPFKITVDKLSILIIKLGDSNNNQMVGYQSSFMYKYQQQQSLFVQKVESEEYLIEVFRKKERIAYYSDISSTEVWKKTGILKNYNGNVLFGIEHPITVNALKNYVELPICSVNEWDDIEIITQAFNQHLKRRIAIVGLNWHRFFIEWKWQESNIIELMMHLRSLYPPNHEFTDRELQYVLGER